MTDIVDGLAIRLEPLGASRIRMFGGTCFMLNGNMTAGTWREGAMFRIGPDNEAAAAARSGAEQMVMSGRPMRGFWLVSAETLEEPDEFDYWMALALAFNKSLPANAGKSKKKRKM